jgi:DNA-binding MarR family transcriptional regulator
MHNYDPEQSVFLLLKQTSKAFREKLNRSFTEAGYDVTGEQWRIIRCLWHKDGQTQQDLSNVVNTEKTGITRIIDSMEKLDLVVRIPDRIDRRQNLIYLTNKGKRLQEELMQIFTRTSLEIQDGIDPEQLDIFRQVLTRIHNNLINS